VTSPPDDDSGLHALIEHYTPDGTLGRLLFGLLVGSSAGAALLLGLFGNFATTLPALVFRFTGVLVGASLFVVALATLWPVYLSVIGNLDNPETYAVGEGLETPESDPAAVLQRRYADGEISRETFERRMDDLLAVDAGRRPSEGGRSLDESGATPRDDAPGERVTAADAPETDELRTTRERARRRREGDTGSGSTADGGDRGEREPSRET